MKALFFLAFFLLMGFFSGCIKKESSVGLYGNTMGTTYRILYSSPNAKNYQKQIDSILIDFNLTFSTYIDSSLISQFNQTDSFIIINDWFKEVMQTSKIVFEETNGAFNPAVMPLVNAWGFGHGERIELDSMKVDSLLRITDFRKVEIIDNKLVKQDRRIQLDFSAIAKGYGVDVISRFLESKNIQNYMVEIGGEVFAKGFNDKKEAWKIGIDKPLKNKTDRRELQAIVQIDNKAMATSGNYRNYYEENGKRYVHTINPNTGYPETNDLLSVSAIAENCMIADAYATAFMVMGYESIYFVERKNGLEAYFIYVNDNKKVHVSNRLKDIPIKEF